MDNGFINVRHDGSSVWHSKKQIKFGNGWEKQLGKAVWNLSRYGVAERGNLKDVDKDIEPKFNIWVTSEVESFVVDGKIDFGVKDNFDKERVLRFMEVLNSATKARGSKPESSNVTDVMDELGF